MCKCDIWANITLEIIKIVLYDFSMRELITDQKLLKILDIVENKLGYIITKDIMPEQERPICQCGIREKEGKFLLKYFLDEIPDHATLCHELMHIVQYFDGFPLRYDYLSAINNIGLMIIRFTYNLILHIDIWEFVETLGFDESNFYNIDNVINFFKNYEIENWAKNPWEIVFISFDIAQALLRKNIEEKKEQLISVTNQNLQQSLQLAKHIINIINKYDKINPMTFPSAFFAILNFFGFPNGSVILIDFKDKDEYLRKSILSL
jgi:hypothetical protein